MLCFRKETEYAIHFLQYLAKDKKSCCSLKKFAATSGISFYFMQKIARKLVRKGLIEAVQGVNGGYRLKVSPKKLSIYKIVETMEDGVSLLPCIANLKTSHCIKKKGQKKCKVRSIVSKLNKELIKNMQKILITK